MTTTMDTIIERQQYLLSVGDANRDKLEGSPVPETVTLAYEDFKTVYGLAVSLAPLFADDAEKIILGRVGIDVAETLLDLADIHYDKA